MNLNKAIKTLERRRDYLAQRTAFENSEQARNWDKQELHALDKVLGEVVCNEPQPDMSDLRAFRKMERNVI
jgi:K+/H+ antiporter YhaU regulatory subunit KhtT